MAIPESIGPDESYQSEVAAKFQYELDELIHSIEGLNFIKANDPGFLRKVSINIKKLYEIVSQLPNK